MYFMMSLCIILYPYSRSKRYCPLLESIQLKYNCFEKEIEFLYVYKFRSVKVIELIFTTTSKFIVISFRLNRNWLKRPDTDGKTVQLVDMKYFCIVTSQEERRQPVWSCFSFFFFTISALRQRIALEHFPESFFIVSADKFYFQDKSFDEYEISFAWLRSTLFQIIWNLKLLLQVFVIFFVSQISSIIWSDLSAMWLVL